ncbi:hypothetical protein DK880_00061 [Candidatus Cardinium hertigii]|uniref:Uncharacterized protein n=1 Tax=Candidatus Cardinium hertigii TaxID=247481 RepID=A0A2Z3L7H6_9BACT|nr:hypothetical protein DK880_00061 [Candidatus Cardinium hertigii]
MQILDQPITAELISLYRKFSALVKTEAVAIENCKDFVMITQFTFRYFCKLIVL